MEYTNTYENLAKKILNDFPIHKEVPCSVSGKYHHGETQEEHLIKVNHLLQHLADEFNLSKRDRDILLCAGWLHDVGEYPLTIKGKVSGNGWRYYQATGWSRNGKLFLSHGSCGALIIDRYKKKFKDCEDCWEEETGGEIRNDFEEIKSIVASHMSHWYPTEPQPKELKQYLVCVADYLASRKPEEIFNYKGRT